MKQAEEILRMKIYVTYSDYGYEGNGDPLYVGTDEVAALSSLIHAYCPTMQIWCDGVLLEQKTKFEREKNGGAG